MRTAGILKKKTMTGIILGITAVLLLSQKAPFAGGYGMEIPEEQTKELDSATDQYFILELQPLMMEDGVESGEEEMLAEESENTVQPSDPREQERLCLSKEDTGTQYRVTAITIAEPMAEYLWKLLLPGWSGQDTEREAEQEPEQQSKMEIFALYDIVYLPDTEGGFLSSDQPEVEQQSSKELLLCLELKRLADVTYYQLKDGELQEHSLEVSFAEEDGEKNGEEAFPVVSCRTRTNHWLVLHFGKTEFDDEEAVLFLEEVTEKASAGSKDKASTADSAGAAQIANVKTEDLLTQVEIQQQSISEKQSEAQQPETQQSSVTQQQPVMQSQLETQPAATAHTHTWVPMTSIVHHDAVYQQIWVEDTPAWDETVIGKEAYDEQVIAQAAYEEQIVAQEAWDEEVLVQEAYEEQIVVKEAWEEPIIKCYDICNECGHVFLPGEDISVHMEAGCWSGWHWDWIQTGTVHHDAEYQTVHHEAVFQTIHHEAVYQTVYHEAVYQTVHHEAETQMIHHDAQGHYEQIVEQAAYEETVVVGSVCSGCGVEK